MTARLETLQALRAIAALMVAAFHLHAAAMAETGTSGSFALFQRGEIGVDLFFVLSGFIITWSAMRKPEQTAQGFLVARFWRVVPPYWAAMGLYLLAFVGLAIITGDTSRLPDGPGLLISVLLLPLPDHVIIVAWSLTLELLFYGLFALTWFQNGKRGFVVLLLAWATAALIAEHAGQSGALGLVLHAAVPEFLWGVVIAWIVWNKAVRWHAPAFTVGAILMAFGMTGGLDAAEQAVGRSVAFGLPAALLIYGAVGLRWRMPRWVMALGDASYLLYLLHLLVFYVVGRGIEMLMGFNFYTSPIAMVGMIGLAVLTSVAAHLWAERPYQNWYRTQTKVHFSSAPIALPRRSNRS